MARSRHSAPAEDIDRIRKKNAAIFVPVRAITARGAPSIEVATLQALVDVAKKYEAMVLEVPTAGGCDYLLWDDGAFFRFRHRTAAAFDDEPEPESEESPLDILRGSVDTVP